MQDAKEVKNKRRHHTKKLAANASTAAHGFSLGTFPEAEQTRYKRLVERTLRTPKIHEKAGLDRKKVKLVDSLGLAKGIGFSDTGVRMETAEGFKFKSPALSRYRIVVNYYPKSRTKTSDMGPDHINAENVSGQANTINMWYAIGYLGDFKYKGRIKLFVTEKSGFDAKIIASLKEIYQHEGTKIASTYVRESGTKISRRTTGTVKKGYDPDMLVVCGGEVWLAIKLTNKTHGQLEYQYNFDILNRRTQEGMVNSLYHWALTHTSNPSTVPGTLAAAARKQSLASGPPFIQFFF